MTADRRAERALETSPVEITLVSEPEPDYRDVAIEFRHLRSFVTVAEELHFGRAAARLFISQPALSQTIARLEQALGVQLLSRSRHSVQLTDPGSALLVRARQLLADKDAAIERVRSVARGEAGVLQVGVALLAGAEAGPVLGALRSEYPDLVVERSAALSERLIEHLQEGRLDTVFVHQVPALATLESIDWEVVRRGRLAVVIDRTNPLAGRGSVALADLRDQTFLVNPRELAPSAYQGTKLMCRHFGGFDPKVAESAATSTLPIDDDWRPILGGSTIAVMPEGTARAVSPPEVAVVPIEPPPGFVLALAWRCGETSPALARLLEFVRRYRDDHGWLRAPSTGGAAPLWPLAGLEV
jgi:DNA-binding transcriptional LysR family regulator